MFMEQGIDLPFATVALIATSDFLVNHYLLLLFLLVTSVVFFFGYITTE
jgi:type II secretory pathway component PulF